MHMGRAYQDSLVLAPQAGVMDDGRAAAPAPDYKLVSAISSIAQHFDGKNWGKAQTSWIVKPSTLKDCFA